MYPDEKGPIGPVDPPGCLPSGKFLFKGLDKLEEIHVKLPRLNGVKEQPVVPLGIFGNDVSAVNDTGGAVVTDLNGGDEIETQQSQVSQVVPGEGLTAQVCVNQPEAFETG